MSRFNYRKLTDKQREQLLNGLTSVFTKLKTDTEIKSFLNQILTPSEQVMIARRLRIAAALMKGLSYLEIRQVIGAGLTTINKIDYWLRETLGEYKELAQTMQKLSPAKPDKKPRRSIKLDYRGDYLSFDSIRHRYPLDFLLINLLLDWPITMDDDTITKNYLSTKAKRRPSK